MDVFLANEQGIAFDEIRVASLARHALAHENVDEGAELSLLFVEPGHIKKLNQRFAGDDHATDVLAFPMMEDDDEGTLMLGDVVICPEIAERNARELGHALDAELATLVVHGMLHLLGYDHQREDDKEKMDARSRAILSSFTASNRG